MPRGDLKKLRVYWDKKEKDVIVEYPQGFFTKSDARYLTEIFSKEFQQELEKRGYDITSVKFEISPKDGALKFTHTRPSHINSEKALKLLKQQP